MAFNLTFAGAEDHSAAGLEELKRGVAALAANSSRPHKQLVQRGSFVYTTGNVLHRAGGVMNQPTLLGEIEHAIAIRNATPYGRWQDNEPALERSQVEVSAKVFVRPTSASIAQDIAEVVASLLAARGTTYLDTLTIAAPALATSGAPGEYYDPLPDAWAAAEPLVEAGSVRSLAVSGVDTVERLSSLASQAKIAPSAIYIDPAPAEPGLAKFASSELGIAKVLMDSDSGADSSLAMQSSTRARLYSAAPKQGEFGASFHTALVPPFAQTSFTALAAARYTVFVPERSIVVAKGYAVKSKYMIA